MCRIASLVLAVFVAQAAFAQSQTWQGLKDVGRNWDYAGVDWSIDRPQTIFAMRHESGGQTLLSTDGGQSWTNAEKDPDFTGLGVVDARTLLRVRGDGIERSTDTGATWKKVSDETPVGRLAIVFGKTVYWLGKKGIFETADGKAPGRRSATCRPRASRQRNPAGLSTSPGIRAPTSSTFRAWASRRFGSSVSGRPVTPPA